MPSSVTAWLGPAAYTTTCMVNSMTTTWCYTTHRHCHVYEKSDNNGRVAILDPMTYYVWADYAPLPH